MNEKPFILIPAKGKSNRLPGKNLLSIGDKSLVQLAINRSLDSGLGDLYVSSESAAILHHVIRYYRNSKINLNGPIIEVRKGLFLIKRPLELSSDIARAVDVCIHAIELLKPEDYISIIVTLPTSPFATAEDLVNAWELSSGTLRKVVMSANKLEINPNTLMTVVGGLGWSISEDIERGPNSNAIWSRNYVMAGRGKEIFKSNGAVFISPCDLLVYHKEQYSDGMVVYVMPEERSLDINTEFDYQVATALWRQKNENSSC